MALVVLFHGAGRPLELADVPTPEPRGAEVLVRVRCCTLCRSDLHTHAGRRQGPTPAVLGHEILGSVEAFGPDAPRVDLGGTPMAVGDRVTWSVVASCGACPCCVEGLPQKCDRAYKYGHEAVTRERPCTGGLAEYVLLRPGTACLRVPDELADRVACPANCATATVAAVLRIGAGADLAGKAVLVLGAGALGLTACAMARSAGARVVIASDPQERGRERAIAFGATHAVSASRDELAAVVAETTAGRGADVVLELAGVR